MNNSRSSDHHVLIVGASHAGVSMAEQLRKQGFDGKITMIDREASMPMERPPLSKAWLIDGGIDGGGSYLLRQAEWYQENKVEFMRGADAVSASPNEKTLTLADETVLNWDSLILATGAVPRRLQMGGNDERMHVLRVPEDAIKLNKAMIGNRNIAIIGGGYIGLEVAASAKKRGLNVTVIEAAPRLLARVASPEASAYFNALHEANSANIRVDAKVNGIDTKGEKLQIDVENSGMLSVDLVVAGIGVIPDTVLAESLGLTTENGFRVDGDYKTPVDDVWAIGDVALNDAGYTKGRMRIESVHHAQMSAEIAAAAMMGIKSKPHEVPWFWSEQYDKKLQSVGFVPSNAEVVCRIGKREGAISFWSFADGVLKAVEAIGDGQAYMLGRAALTNRHSVTAEQIADPAFDLKSLMA